MDGPVSATAASVIAISTLAFQLAQSTKKLFDFWDSIQHAPEEINDIKSELESLTLVLEQIGYEAQNEPSNESTRSVLRQCSRRIDTIRSLTAHIEPGFESSKTRIRKWSALRAVCKREKIKKVQDSLDSLKSTLELVLVNDVR